MCVRAGIWREQSRAERKGREGGRGRERGKGVGVGRKGVVRRRGLVFAFCLVELVEWSFRKMMGSLKRGAFCFFYLCDCVCGEGEYGRW